MQKAIKHKLLNLLVLVVIVKPAISTITVSPYAEGLKGKTAVVSISWTEDDLFSVKIKSRLNNHLTYDAECFMKEQSCSCKSFKSNIHYECSNGKVKFIFTPLGITDIGKYVVSISTLNGNVLLREVQISVLAPPKDLSLSCDSTDLKINSALSCQCTAISGSPAASIKWNMVRENGDKINLTDYAQNNEKILTFANMSSQLSYIVKTDDNNGEVICSVGNEHGLITAKKAVRVKFYEISPKYIRSMEGESPNVTLTWEDEVMFSASIKKHDEDSTKQYDTQCFFVESDRKCKVCQRFQGSNIVSNCSENRIIWTFTSLELRNKGLHYINLGTVSGIQLKDSIEVDVLVKPKDFKMWCSASVIKEESILQCTCNATSANPAATVSWTLYKENNSSVIISDSADSVNGGIFSSITSTVRHSIAKEYNGGRIECSIGNEIGVIKEFMKLNVTYLPRIITDFDATKVYTQRSTMTIECAVDANPPAEIKWILPGGSQRPGATLTLTNLDRENKGIYKCVASNKLGSSSKQTTVSIEYAPNCKTLNFTNNEVDEKTNTVTLSCSIASNPPSSVTWKIKKSGASEQIDVKQNNGKYTMTNVKTSGRSDQMTSITIHSVTTSDEAIYECNSQNSIGSCNAQMNLKILKNEASSNSEKLKSEGKRPEFQIYSIFVLLLVSHTIIKC